MDTRILSYVFIDSPECPSGVSTFETMGDQVRDTIILAIPLPSRESFFLPIVFDYPTSPARQGSLGVQGVAACRLYCRKSLVTSLRASLVAPWRIPSSLVMCVYQFIHLEL